MPTFFGGGVAAIATKTTCDSHENYGARAKKSTKRPSKLIGKCLARYAENIKQNASMICFKQTGI